jgi:AhpD family alkylhydroperoxidase
MSQKRLTSMFGQLALTQIRHVAPVRPGTAPDLVSRVYQQIEQEFGMLAPPLALHAPAPPVLAASWLLMREPLIVTGQVERPVKEAVATAVSLGNTCPFCVTVHSNTLSGLTGGVIDARVLAEGASTAGDPLVRAAGAWATDSRTEEGALRYEPACTADEAPELIGTAVLLHYLNRMVNVFLGEVPLPPGVPKIALGGVMRTLGAMMRRAAAKPHPAGASLDLLPPVPVPADLSWTLANATIADAFARASAAVDAAGAESVPEPVRDVVAAELAGWHGEARGPSRAWVESAVSGLPQAQRAAGRLALLTAMTSYQVDKSIIDAFRRQSPDDVTLIGLTSWASLTASRRVASWIPVSPATAAAPTLAAPGPTARS